MLMFFLSFCRCRWSLQEGNQGYSHPIRQNLVGWWPTSLRTQEIRWSRCPCSLPKIIPLKLWFFVIIPTYYCAENCFAFFAKCYNKDFYLRMDTWFYNNHINVYLLYGDLTKRSRFLFTSKFSYLCLLLFKNIFNNYIQ